LEAWHQEGAQADWAGPSEAKAQFRSASVLQDNRVVFNIAGNQYQLVVKINYPYRIVYVRYIASHKEYDHIDADIIRGCGGPMNISPIKSKRDYERALSRIERLSTRSRYEKRR
jgi:mRNA interferase HigB